MGWTFSDPELIGDTDKERIVKGIATLIDEEAHVVHQVVWLLKWTKLKTKWKLKKPQIRINVFDRGLKLINSWFVDDQNSHLIPFLLYDRMLDHINQYKYPNSLNKAPK